jgi:hypothetical protein
MTFAKVGRHMPGSDVTDFEEVWAGKEAKEVGARDKALEVEEGGLPGPRFRSS